MRDSVRATAEKLSSGCWATLLRASRSTSLTSRPAQGNWRRAYGHWGIESPRSNPMLRCGHVRRPSWVTCPCLLEQLNNCRSKPPRLTSSPSAPPGIGLTNQLRRVRSRVFCGRTDNSVWCGISATTACPGWPPSTKSSTAKTGCCAPQRCASLLLLNTLPPRCTRRCRMRSRWHLRIWLGSPRRSLTCHCAPMQAWSSTRSRRCLRHTQIFEVARVSRCLM